MFDDHTNQPGGVPNNLPVGEPDDIFASTDKTPATPKQNPSPPAAAAPAADPSEAPAQTPAAPTALSAGALKPKAPAAGAQTPQSPAATLSPKPPPVAPINKQPAGVPAATSNQIKEPGIGKGILITAIIIVFLIIVFGGGWWVYASFIKQDTPTNNFTSPPTQTQPQNEVPAPVVPEPVEEEVVTEPDVTENTTEENQNDFDNVVLFGEQLDTDGDGLDDAREASLGTDPNNWDTDNDLLNDFDEVSVWQTDPFNPDTDGDGFEDGSEVKNGYNPNGPGRIFEPPANDMGSDQALDESNSAGIEQQSN